MDYAYGIPLAIANLSPSLSPMQRLLNAITSFASFMRRDCRSLAWQSARSARGRSEHHLPSGSNLTIESTMGFPLG